MSWTASSPSGFVHHYLLWAVTLSLSFPLSRALSHRLIAIAAAALSRSLSLEL